MFIYVFQSMLVWSSGCPGACASHRELVHTTKVCHCVNINWPSLHVQLFGRGWAVVRQESIRKISSSLQIHKILTVFDYLYHCLYVLLDRVFSFSIVTSKGEGVIEIFFFSAAVVCQDRLIEFFSFSLIENLLFRLIEFLFQPDRSIILQFDRRRVV